MPIASKVLLKYLRWPCKNGSLRNTIKELVRRWFRIFDVLYIIIIFYIILCVSSCFSCLHVCRQESDNVPFPTMPSCVNAPKGMIRMTSSRVGYVLCNLIMYVSFQIINKFSEYVGQVVADHVLFFILFYLNVKHTYK